MPRNTTRLRAAAAVVVATVAAGCATAAPASLDAGLHSLSVDVDGVTREYDLYAPAKASSKALIVDLHGLTGTPQGQADLSGLREVAEQEGFVVAHPAGSAGAWDAFADRAADVAFLRAVVADVSRRVDVDPVRVYATGMSNGGGMAHRLACDASDLFAAVAPVAGAYLFDVDCAPPRPVPILAFHGTDDRVVPFTGAGTALPDITEWAGSWAARNGCDTAPVSERLAADVERLTWPGCDAGADVVLVVVEGGRHGWPGTDNPRRSDATTSSIDASSLIWEFFASHPMP